MRRRIIIFFLLIVVSFTSYGQLDSKHVLKPSDSLNIKRRNTVVISEAALSSLALIGLDQLWYKDYPRSKFQTLNDNSEWLQMDKLGHVFSSYQIG